MTTFRSLLQRLSRKRSARRSSRRQSPGTGFQAGRIGSDSLEQRVLLAAAPQVTSIQLASGSPNTGPTVRFTATFSSVVSGVDAADFVSLPSGGISASSLSVVAVSGSVYTITANGVTGTGTLAIRLVDNGSIKGSDGQLLQGGVRGPGAQLADFNSDGRLDLISVTGAQSIGVALGTGDGTFGPFQTTLFASNATTRLLIADLNGDGKLDIVRATYNTSEGSDLLLGQGNGSFTPGAALPFCPTASLLVDVNSDGKLDLIRPLTNLEQNGDITPGNILTSLGNGNGTFQSPIESSDGALPQTLFSGDWNNDGQVDLLSTYGYPQNDPEIGNIWVEVRHGLNNGAFNQPVAPNTSGGLINGHITGGNVLFMDWNQDGRLDSVASEPLTGQYRVRLGLANGAFEVGPGTILAIPSQSVPTARRALDGDSSLDLISVRNSGQEKSVLVTTSTGTTAYALENAASDVELGDLNQDGFIDIVTSSGTILLGSSTGAFRGNGSFTGTSATIVEAPTIIDNSGPGFSTIGRWIKLRKGHLTNAVRAVGLRRMTKAAQWRFTGLANGVYEVAATWQPARHQARNASYQILSGANSTQASVTVNQSVAPTDFQANGSSWKILASVTVTDGVINVELGNQARGSVFADAIRIRRIVS